MYLLLVLLQLFSFVATQEVTGVFTSFDSLTWLDSGNYHIKYPAAPAWIAELGWKIDGSLVSAGDTFTLTMPCVFKFTTTQSSVNLHVGDINYATCDFAPGGLFSANSELHCILLDAVQDSTLVVGKLTLPIVFNTGRSSADVDMFCSTFYKSGLNTVSFTDGDKTLSIVVEFKGGSHSGDINRAIYSARILPAGDQGQHYLLGSYCPGVLKMATIGMTINDGASTFDCSTAHVYLTNSVNDWYYPQSFESIDPVFITCTPKEFLISYKEVPDGYRVFIEAILNIVDGVNPIVYYNDMYMYTTPIDKSIEVTWYPYTHVEADGPGKEIITVTETWTGSYTETVTKPYEDEDLTITIDVNVPIPTITLTETYVGITTSYTTYTVEPGETASVVVYDPVHTTITEESCWESDKSITTTIIDPGWASDTILIVTPCEVTSTEQMEESLTLSSSSEYESDDITEIVTHTTTTVSEQEEESLTFSSSSEYEPGVVTKTVTQTTTIVSEQATTIKVITYTTVITVSNCELVEIACETPGVTDVCDSKSTTQCTKDLGDDTPQTKSGGRSTTKPVGSSHGTSVPLITPPGVTYVEDGVGSTGQSSSLYLILTFLIAMFY
ncbi:uncharacterized protein SPAPADRAFT_64435 [Spathaspora passalidarum NRRL Y-27907]|uniref:Agglutinin-like protein N-terminal domain-containing protein n=1 Tax=Spathaspora passalidarum (strain NRRL Y-27907 / 11-Y1) TaxID=619300 RepID=G3AGE7_SPAPN|nr:uncharacterized protein SPAPADRAFT_64435 [Spathaspora passalidarum NRRL Y-27907]EGW35286.1 hypothetical protein SPAPADRAFT_64435 [Spathaspora passalidarum NRRL Y-27907]QTC09997.1 agglutinin-like protein [Spathaspora passalidarum]